MVRRERNACIRRSSVRAINEAISLFGNIMAMETVSLLDDGKTCLDCGGFNTVGSAQQWSEGARDFADATETPVVVRSSTA
jgi:hypothetical protein